MAQRAKISQKILQTHYGLFPQTYHPADIKQQDSRYIISYRVVVYMLWFNFIFGSSFISFVLTMVI